MKSSVCQCSSLHLADINFFRCIHGIVAMQLARILEGVAKYIR